MEIIGTLHQICWGNPYSEPPDGAPRVLAEWFTPRWVSAVPEPLQNFPHTIGGGYGLGVSHYEVPAKRKPPEVLASIRQKALRRRVNKKAPMFSDQFFAEAVAKKPEYFQGKGYESADAERNEAEAKRAERLAYLQANANRLLIYGEEPPECAEMVKAVRETFDLNIPKRCQLPDGVNP